MAFTLPDLPYDAGALEPVIDQQTMEIHHGKHHNGYCTKLNAAIEGTPLDSKSLEEIFAGDMPTAVRNNGGGYYNHCLFWEIMKPGGSQPSGQIASALDSELGGYDKFKEAFTQAALGRFGSGWAWLIVGQDGKLAICDTPNQDNPLMKKFVDKVGTPILGIDVWEHAYYLKYQNRRPDYVEAFFDIINWEKVNENYAKAKG